MVDFILYREIRGSRVTRTINRYAYANFIRCNKDLRHFYVRQCATLGRHTSILGTYIFILLASRIASHIKEETGKRI